MKSRRLMCITAITLFAAFAIPVQLYAQEDAGQVSTKHHHYKFIDIGTFDGPSSGTQDVLKVLNSRGVLTGGADTSTPDRVIGCFQQRNSENFYCGMTW